MSPRTIVSRRSFLEAMAATGAFGLAASLTEGWVVSAQTALVVAACYAVIESAALQAVFLAFPELLLLVLAVDLWVGRWMGLRLTEYFRFAGLMERAARA